LQNVPFIISFYMNTIILFLEYRIQVIDKTIYNGF